MVIAASVSIIFLMLLTAYIELKAYELPRWVWFGLGGFFIATWFIGLFSVANFIVDLLT